MEQRIIKPTEITLSQRATLMTNIQKLFKPYYINGEEAGTKANKIIAEGKYSYFYTLFFGKQYDELRNYLKTI